MGLLHFARAGLLAGAMTMAWPSIAQSPMSADAPPPAFPAPTSAAPAPASDMQAVLDAHKALGAQPIEKLTPAQARMQPAASDAAHAVMMQKGIDVTPDPSVVTVDAPYGRKLMQFARIYKPAAAPAGALLPVIVYYHGGGWVIADINKYDDTPRFLSKQLNAIVVSVEYSHAPEAKFPAQHEDAALAYRWTLDQARGWGGDLSHVVLAGESAGGNLAVATAIYARDHGLTAPVAILAVYPIANSTPTLPSKVAEANAKPLNTPMLSWFGYYYSKTPADNADPRINLVKANLRGLPQTTIINAEHDPLRLDGETLAVALRKAGVSVEQRTFPGVTHEFFGMGKVVRGAYDAEGYAVARLRPVLAARM